MPGIRESGPKRNAVVIGCSGCVPSGSGTAPEDDAPLPLRERYLGSDQEIAVAVNDKLAPY